jgi:hypothetical protein
MKPKILIALEAVLDDIDVEFIRMLGQSMRSTSGGYGFDATSDIDKSPGEAVKEWAQMIYEDV